MNQSQPEKINLASMGSHALLSQLFLVLRIRSAFLLNHPKGYHG